MKLTGAKKRVLGFRKRVQNGKVHSRVRGVIKKDGKGVLYVGSLPFGLFEEELKGYFGQFGRVTRVKVARSHKTGQSKGYAFVEFADEEVAEIAKETMNNVLMYDRILKCSRVEGIREDSIFKGFKITRNDYPMKRQRQNRIAQQNRMKAPEAAQRTVRNALNKLKKVHQRLKKAGIEYRAVPYKPLGEDQTGKKKSVRAVIQKKKKSFTRLYRLSMLSCSKMWREWKSVNKETLMK